MPFLADISAVSSLNELLTPKGKSGVKTMFSVSYESPLILTPSALPHSEKRENVPLKVSSKTRSIVKVSFLTYSAYSLIALANSSSAL